MAVFEAGAGFYAFCNSDTITLLPSVGARPTGKTDAAKDLVILAKERRIAELEEENRKLERQLKAALGKAYDRL